MPHPATLPIDILLLHCEVRRQRRSGPGGQHRNKVESGIFLVHQPTGIQVSATERRSQGENRAIAIERMRLRLAVDVRSEPPLESPSELWQTRCAGGRISVSLSHTDFPALLSEALDVLALHDWRVASAADHLKCSSTQLVTFLGRAPEALQELNRQREDRGLRRLAPRD